jgi:hypothetical protein
MLQQTHTNAATDPYECCNRPYNNCNIDAGAGGLPFDIQINLPTAWSSTLIPTCPDEVTLCERAWKVRGGETGVGVGLASLKIVEMTAGVGSAGLTNVEPGNWSVGRMILSFKSRVRCAGECLQAPSSKPIGLRPRNVTLIYMSLLTMVDVQGLEVWKWMANPGRQQRVGSPDV